MLHFETVEPETFSILERLKRLKALRPFSLVGGTDLSLRHCHPTSVDLDLFNHKKFDHNPITEALIKEFGKGYSTESKGLRRGYFLLCERGKN